MMNLLNKASNSFPKCRNFTPEIYRVSLYSTQTHPSYSDTLFHRFHSGFVPQASIIPDLDKWVVEGRTVNHGELIKIIKDFRRRHRFASALEVSEWMNAIDLFDLAPGDIAVRVDLISKVHGVDQAETYFNSLPDNLKVSQVYGALLNSYVDAKILEKAEFIMQKISTMDNATTFTCNGMLNLYSHLGKHEKLEALSQYMEDRGIAYNRYSYSILLNAYATSCDIKRMEKLLMKLEMDHLVSASFHAYVIGAKGYLKTDATEKALITLKKAEHLIEHHERNFAYLLLLTIYAKMGKKNEIYRLWNLIKRQGKLPNTSYLCMLSSLKKVDDLDGAAKILEEWEENNVYFDIRVPNFLIHSYCSTGHVKKAELIVSRLMNGGRELKGSTWSRMALGYRKCNQMDKAVEMMKKAVQSSHPGWKPHLPTLASCLEYLKLSGDSIQAEEIMKLLEQCQLSEGTKKRLFWYLENGCNSQST